MTHEHDHGDGHGHGHGHDHDHLHAAHGSENPWAGQGAVLLDIGGDVGALVVEMPEAMEGVEVDIRPAGAAHDPSVHLPHVAVVKRPTPEGPLASLVYPEVTEGDYELLLKGSDRVEMTATVAGGAVTEETWPGQ